MGAVQDLLRPDGGQAPGRRLLQGLLGGAAAGYVWKFPQPCQQSLSRPPPYGDAALPPEQEQGMGLLFPGALEGTQG